MELFEPEVIPVVQGDAHHISPLYLLLWKFCNICPCSEERQGEISFLTNRQYTIFAYDNFGNEIGCFGGFGDLLDDDFPVYYAWHEQKRGIKLADDLHDFFLTAIYYPFWQNILLCEQKHIPYSIKALEEEYQKIDLAELTAMAKQILSNIGFPWQSRESVLEKFIQNIHGESEFIYIAIP